VLQLIVSRLLLSVWLLLLTGPVVAQADDHELGAWYMYFFDARFDNSRWGFQGDVQSRNWDICCDVRQLLARGGLTWHTKDNSATLVLGYARFFNGESGPSSANFYENRIYQDILLPQKLSERIFLRHRFRFEQRWIEDQDFRTRFRYTIFADVPLNMTSLKKGAWYLAFYNEIFFNGERDIGNGKQVETFDRNWLYGALGYSLSDTLRLQGGYMYEYTDTTTKGQLQFSLHQFF